MFIRKFLTAVALAALGCAVPASADIVGYSAPSPGFATATSDDAFSNISFIQGSLGDSTSDLGVVFSSPGGLLGTTGAALGAGWPSGSALEVNNGYALTITIPAGVTAVSFYIGSTDGSFDSVVVTDSGGGSPDIIFPSPTASPQFLGVVTDSSFNTFTITEAGMGNVAIDDMQIGGQTPEVATLLLVGSGLLGMGLMRRRRGQKPLQELPAC